MLRDLIKPCEWPVLLAVAPLLLFVFWVWADLVIVGTKYQIRNWIRYFQNLED